MTMKQTCDDRDTPHQYGVVGYRYVGAKPSEATISLAVLVCMKCLHEHLVPIHETPVGKVVAS